MRTKIAPLLTIGMCWLFCASSLVASDLAQAKADLAEECERCTSAITTINNQMATVRNLLVTYGVPSVEVLSEILPPAQREQLSDFITTPLWLQELRLEFYQTRKAKIEAVLDNTALTEEQMAQNIIALRQSDIFIKMVNY